MNLGDLFRRLSHGPLSNLSVGGDGSGVIPTDSQPKIVDYTNIALLRLYTRFTLSEKELLLKLDESVTQYKLTPDYTVSAGLPDVVHYIQDSVAVPYTGDLIKILTVHSLLHYGPLPLNDENDAESVYTPQVDVLQIPKPIQDQMVSIIYQARHPILDTQTIDLSATIHVPAALEEAVMEYVAFKVLNSMNGQEHAVRAADHLSNYKSLTDDAVAYDLVNSSVSTTNEKFCDRGFV